MRQAHTILSFQTSGRGLLEVTGEVRSWTSKQHIEAGLHLVLPPHLRVAPHSRERGQGGAHGSGALFEMIALEDPARYAHDDEGPDDMPAHIRAALTQVQLTIPVTAAMPALGTWQGIYLFEHRRRPHRREIAVHLMGE